MKVNFMVLMMVLAGTFGIARADIVATGSYEGDVDPGSANPAWNVVSLYGSSYTVGDGYVSNTSANGQNLYQMINWSSLFSADSGATVDIRFRMPANQPGVVVFKIDVGFPAVGGFGGSVAIGIQRGEIYSLDAGGFDTVVSLGDTWHTLRLIRTFDSGNPGVSTNWGLKVYLDDTYLGWANGFAGLTDVLQIGDSWGGGDTVAWDIDYIRWANAAYDVTPTANPIVPAATPITASGSYEGDVDPGAASPAWSVVSLYGSSYTVGGGYISNTSANGQVLYQTTNWSGLFSADSGATMDIRFRMPANQPGVVVFKIDVGFPAVGGYGGGIAVGIQRGEIYSLGSGGFDTVVSLGDTWHTLRLVRTFNSSDPGASTNWGLEVYLDDTDLGWAVNIGGQADVIKVGDSWDGGDTVAWDIDYIRWANAAYNVAPATRPMIVAEPVATPVISRTNRYISGPTEVTIGCETPGARIYYTTNGSNPTSASPLYTGALTIDPGTRLKAIAMADGYTNSAIASVTYVLGYDVPAIGAITTDGNLSDWSNSTGWSREYVAWSGTLSSSTKARFAYNDVSDMLYVAIQTDQADGGCAVVGLSKNINGNPSLGTDATQLSFDLQSDGSVLIRNEIATYGIKPACITTGVTAGCRYADGVWTYEVAIPLWKVWTDASQGRETLSPGDVVYVYSCMQDSYGTANGTDLSYEGNPAFYAGAFDLAAALTLAGVPAVSGDANGDHKVDVSDLGILAANYGMTAGATWDKGDFNQDGKVDVSDLGILAANYGTGTGTSLDFNKDAQTLGLAVDGGKTAKEETPVASALGCGSAGLPLVAGLAFLGLMLVKLDE